jgi:hypothetical protein
MAYARKARSGIRRSWDSGAASLIFLLDSLVIGLGAFGHGLQVRHLHAAIDAFPIESDMHSMI